MTPGPATTNSSAQLGDGKIAPRPTRQIPLERRPEVVGTTEHSNRVARLPTFRDECARNLRERRRWCLHEHERRHRRCGCDDDGSDPHAHEPNRQRAGGTDGDEATALDQVPVCIDPSPRKPQRGRADQRRQSKRRAEPAARRRSRKSNSTNDDEHEKRKGHPLVLHERREEAKRGVRDLTRIERADPGVTILPELSYCVRKPRCGERGSDGNRRCRAHARGSRLGLEPKPTTPPATVKTKK